MLMQGGRLAGVALQPGDGGQQLVVGSAFQLVAFFIEQALAGFQHLGNSGFERTLAVGQQDLGRGGAQRGRFAADAFMPRRLP
ncbi:MAG: hypothetical protein ACP5OY_06860 [Halothiobacillaceae bacterium]